MNRAIEGPLRVRASVAGGLVLGVLALLQPACRGDRGSSADEGSGAATAALRGDAEEVRGRAAPNPGGPSDAGEGVPEIEEIRKARAALASAGIPLYPGARGLDSTEYEANTAPFIAIDFFSLDPPEKVAAFYDRALKKLTARRDTTLTAGVVRYEFERDFSGVEVKPWDPQGADSSAMIVRFDRRDAQGVTSAELDEYGKLLARARTHIVVAVPRPEPR